ncbi:hypothetical protein TPY_3053 [Sulfobacillus acidophilus TPY]|uniref:DUF2249 domain-containing protein n=1 Tax=Sulfobacillus acidophilus (strain ATCC 700253 / DSM 10332 / NAL) TaxID=679936 RepID=G8TS17_SULAD|nr:hypothetical protein TPY_3053 [Sulfobacillus acidophilus TPY]AEW04343.1 hypothetical protein Sulac_0840 [Sulfobacillus acidophilus DSM 10332]
MLELDVRPILRAGGEPFDQIMTFVSSLPAGEGFRLYATFRPDPLLQVLKTKGYRGEAEELPDGDWVVHFYPMD